MAIADTVKSLLTQPATNTYDDLPFDEEWYRAAFVAGPDDLVESDYNNLGYSDADDLYHGTGIGEHHCINPPYQWAVLTDYPSKGLNPDAVDPALTYNGGSLGFGGFNAEMINANHQIIHIRGGVPSYNSMTQFFTGFYDSGMAMMARTGRADRTLLDKLFYTAGQGLGLVIAPLAIIPMALMMAGVAVRYVLRIPASKYCYMKPAMALVYNAINNMLNQLLVNDGTINYSRPEQLDQIIGKEYKISKSEFSILSAVVPQLTKDGVLDVYKIANASKLRQMRHEALIMKRMEQSAGNDDFFGLVRKAFRDDVSGTELNQPQEGEKRGMSLEGYLKRYLDVPIISGLLDKAGQAIDAVKAATSFSEVDLRVSANGGKIDEKNPYKPQTEDAGIADYFLSEWADGAGWLSIIVNYTGEVSESFTSSHQSNELASKINSISEQARNIRINFADGNIDSSGAMQTAFDAARSVVTGALDTLQLSGLAALAGNALADIPDHWSGSQAQFNRTSYTIPLMCPYNNPVSRAFDIYYPLACLFGISIPLATGNHSYTSPFYIELFDRGRNYIRMGQVTDLTLKRGINHYGYTPHGHSLGFEASISIRDMSTMLAMPIQPGFSLVNGILDNENNWSDYLAALAGMPLKDVVYRLPMLKYQLARKRADIETFFSSAHIAQYVTSFAVMDLPSIFMRGTDKN